MSSQETTLGPSRQERRKTRTRQALLAAVRELVAVGGVDELTITQIAEHADVGVGSFYNYFESKEEIIRAAAGELFSEVDQQIAASLATAPGSDPAERLAVLILFVLRELEPNIVWAGFFARTSTEFPMVSSPLAARAFRDLDEGHRDGLFELPPGVGAFLLVGAVNSSLRALSAGALSESNLDVVTRAMLRALGLTPGKAQTATRKALTRLDLTS